MNALLDPRAAARLAKLLGLIGSIHDAEALAAARKANEFVHLNGLTWPDVIRVETSRRREVDPHRDWRLELDLCVEHIESLNGRDQDFIRSLRSTERWREPSAKQMAWLGDIVTRLRRGVA